MVGVVAGQGAQAVRAEELVLVEHAGEDPPQLVLVDHGEHPPAVDARPRGHRGWWPTARAWRRSGAAAGRPGSSVEVVHQRPRQDRGGAQRQEADDRPHLQPLGLPVRAAEHVVEEPVLLVPQLVVVVADAVHRRGDEHEVLGELEDHVLVDGIVPGQLDGDAEHALGVERHPRRAVGLLEVAAGGQRRAAVEHADVVESEEAALEHVASRRVLAVDPPGEVHEQLLERALQPGDVALAALFAARSRRRAAWPRRAPAG